MKGVTVRSWNLNVKNLSDSIDFYRTVLGAEVINRHQVQGVDVARLSLGGFSIGLFDASEGESPGVPHHTIEINASVDPEECRQELEEMGIAVSHLRPHSEREGGGYSIYIVDPSGNRLELSNRGS